MSLKMYVLIREGLSNAQQAVQAGHALSQFGLEHPGEFGNWQKSGNILVYLSVKSINTWATTLEDGQVKHSVFWERDGGLGYTAIAVAPNWTCQYLLFKDLPLALQPAKSKRWWQR